MKLADWAKRKLRGKIPELQKALEGHLTVHHRFLLQLLWKQLDEQEELIDQLDGKIEKKTRPLAAEIDRLDRLPPRPLVSFPLLPCFLALPLTKSVTLSPPLCCCRKRHIQTFVLFSAPKRGCYNPPAPEKHVRGATYAVFAR